MAGTNRSPLKHGDIVAGYTLVVFVCAKEIFGKILQAVINYIPVAEK